MRLLRRATLLAVLIAFSLALADAVLAGEHSDWLPASQEAPPRREKVICGPNAVFAMLSAYQIKVDHGLVEELVRAHPAGMSLSELSNALSSRGVAATVRRCAPSELAAVPTPYIAHVSFEFSGGHYLVVLSQDHQAANVLEPTTGATFTTPLARLSSAGNGYVIVPKRQSSLLAVSALASALIVCGFLGCYRFRGPKKSLLVFVFALAPLSTAHAAKGDAPSQPAPRANDLVSNWRNNGNSGANCLWLLLDCAGRHVDYRELQARAGGDQGASLEALSRIASNCGLNLAPVRLTFDQLKQSSSPLVLFMEPEGIGSGTYGLLVHVTEEKVSYLEGGAVRWVQQDRAEFRRSWSGYALAPAPARYRLKSALRALSLVGLSAAVWCIARSRATPKQFSCVIASFLLLCVHRTPAAQAGEARLPHELRRALVAQAEQLAPLTVSWVHERHSAGDATTFAQSGRATRSSVGSDEKRVTIQAGMLYTRTDRREAGIDVMEHSFDGINYFIGRPPLANRLHQASLTKLDVRWLAAREPKSPWFSAVYFDLVGFSIPSTSAELNSQAGVQARLLKLLDDGARLISCIESAADGRERIRVEIEVQDPEGVPRPGSNARQAQRAWRRAGLSDEQIEHNLAAMQRRLAAPANKRLIFHFDPRREYALAEFEERKANGSLLLSAANMYWQQVPQRALWLPQSCRVLHYAHENMLFPEPVLLSTFRVTSIDAGVQPPALFTLNYSSPGTRVHEQGADGRRESYEIPATPADLAKVIAQARTAKILRSPRATERYWWVIAFIGAALTLVALVWTAQILRSCKREGR